MAKLLTALEFYVSNQEEENHTKIFLAGGISGCSNWQQEVVNQLIDNENIIIFNPRRLVFDVTNILESERQIVWEYEHLKISNLIVFWFAKETLNPITLYELGLWGNSKPTKIIIGTDRAYARREDVKFQTKLARPEIVVNENFEDFIKNIKQFLNK